MNEFDIPILNPAWTHILDVTAATAVLDPAAHHDKQSRVHNWIQSIAIPYIKKHLSDFCVKVFTTDVRMEMETREVNVLGGASLKYVGQTSFQLEAFVNSEDLRRTGINTAITGDPWITSLNLTYDNFVRDQAPQGWTYGIGPRMRYDTRLSIDIVTGEHLKSVLPGKEMWLFMGHSVLMDISDWLVNAAKVPLTTTKLPWKEAVRLSAKWHEDEVLRRRKAALKKITKGSVVRLGKLEVSGGSLDVGDKYDVWWLTDKEALEYETVLQHHCVWSYWPTVQARRCAILHMCNTDPAKETDRWTVEVRPLKAFTNEQVLKVVQMRGVVNRNPHPEFPAAITQMLEFGHCHSVFTNDSHIDRDMLFDHFNPLRGVTSAVS